MKDYTQVNINLLSDDVKMLERMMNDDAYENRSSWIRRLIRQEWARRYSAPNPLISVADAISAGKSIE